MSIEQLWEYALEQGIEYQALSTVITKYTEHSATQRIETLMDLITETIGDSDGAVSLDDILKDKQALRKQIKERKEKQKQ